MGRQRTVRAFVLDPEHNWELTELIVHVKPAELDRWAKLGGGDPDAGFAEWLYERHPQANPFKAGQGPEGRRQPADP